MPTNIEFLAYLIGLIFSVATMFAAIGYFRQGKDQGRLSANTLMRDDISELTKKVDLQDKEIRRLTAQVQILQTSIEEKDKKLVETLAILQGRDPQMQDFVNSMQEYIDSSKPMLEQVKIDILPVVKKLDKFLDKQII